MVRKEFKPHSDGSKAHEIELQNLQILKHLHHPNIIEVKGSYAYREKLNLIFPRAQGAGGTVADLLKAPCPPELQSGAEILFALSGLCSAVSAVHRFVSKGDNLELIGCHHDLKPSNVLIEGTRFLLADFGLSRFKDPSQSSETPARTVLPYYTAPECSATASDDKKPLVRRSSDIWSLGCTITEVITYMLEGAKGVKAFEQERRHVDGPSVKYRFHRKGVENPGVAKWVHRMKHSDSGTHRLLGELVDRMLQIEPLKRPGAQFVEGKMRFIAVFSLSQKVSELYESVSDKRQSVEVDVARARFEGWRYGCSMHEVDDNSYEQWTQVDDLQMVKGALNQTHSTLRDIDKRVSTQLSTIQILRQSNNLLINHLSSERYRRATEYCDFQLMTERSRSLIENASETSMPDGPKLQMLSRVTALAVDLQAPGSSSRREKPVDLKRLQLKSRMGDFQIGTLSKGDGNDQRQVLVEVKRYEERRGEQYVAAELRTRLELLTDILRKVQGAPEEERFRVLPCIGFFQDHNSSTCGLIYEYPSPNSLERSITLQSALKKSKDQPELQPSLEMRFELANILASSVLQFHKVSWLQKSINSFNVAFFHARSETWSEHLDSPVFLGYSYSRSRDTRTFTEGPDQNKEHSEYQHPHYREKGFRYRAEYDYYSLGLLLLEIGVWEPFEDWKLSSQRGKSLLDKILEEVVPRLRVSMGSRYQFIVERCLRGEFDGDGASSDEAQYTRLCLNFSKLVVERLATFSL